MTTQLNNPQMKTTLISIIIVLLLAIGTKCHAQDTIEPVETQFELIKYDMDSYKTKTDTKMNNAGAELQFAYQHQNTSRILMLAGSLIALVGIKQGTAFTVIGGCVSLSGLILNWESWTHIKKASEVFIQKE